VVQGPLCEAPVLFEFVVEGWVVLPGVMVEDEEPGVAEFGDVELGEVEPWAERLVVLPDGVAVLPWGVAVLP
jgi:hypothetical protein